MGHALYHAHFLDLWQKGDCLFIVWEVWEEEES